MSILKFLVFLQKSQVMKVIEKENFCVQRDASGMSFLHPLGNVGVRGNKLQVKFEFFFFPRLISTDVLLFCSGNHSGLSSFVMLLTVFLEQLPSAFSLGD